MRAPPRSLLLTVLLLGRDVVRARTGWPPGGQGGGVLLPSAVPQRALQPPGPLVLGAPPSASCTWPDCCCPFGPRCGSPE